jgi:manganese transport protein
MILVGIWSRSSMDSASTVPSLEDIHASVPIPPRWWRRFLAFSGPAFMVSVGYMDPGNWGTDLEAGSRFGHRLLWVLLLSNLMALLLQSLASRLGIVSGRDLAQACRESYPPRTVFMLWILTEIAIAATDLAEVIGTIIALKLLFQIPYGIGLAIAATDTLLLLALQRRGVRLLELLTLTLVGVIASSFLIEIALARPDWAAVVRGLLPGLDPHEPFDSLYVAISMLGATVMPHNLYLHSALVQTRAFPQTTDGKRLACKYNLIDSALALNGALFINAAILILAATKFAEGVKTLQKAHELIGTSLWGGYTAGVLFAVALLASGQSSTLTGTLAGQVVMEGFVRLRVRPWVRRLMTRLAALLPALLVLSLASAADGESVDASLLQLLILSQAILSFQLPFAIIPLVQFTGDRRRMSTFANPVWLQGLAWLSAAIVVCLNSVLIWMSMGEWAEAIADLGWHPLWIYGTVGPIALILACFLVWIALYPRFHSRAIAPPTLIRPKLAQVRYQRIGVAVEFSSGDNAVLAQAAETARLHGAPLLLIHVVEGPGADYYGSATDDQESRADRHRLGELVEYLQLQDLKAEGMLGYGEPAAELVRIARERQLDFLILGTHGHRFFADLALGQTVSPVLHRLQIPILVVPTTGERGTAAP